MLCKVAFETIGCKVNLYDTEAMMELFEKEGYTIVDFNDFANIYIINTCTVTNIGDKKSRQIIRRAKATNPDAIVVATGCYAQVSPKEVAKIDGVNIVIGNKDRHKIVEIIKQYEKDYNKDTLNCVSDIMQERIFEDLDISNFKNRARVYLKIQEGCNNFCTYCIIPYARGVVKSREQDKILKEVRRLAESGFKEVVLTGIHILSYGIDLKESITLIDIIEKIHDIDKIERIRLSSIEPLIITDDFIKRIKKLPKFCNHYHLSLQSGSNKILEKMKRNYTKEQFEDAVNKLNKSFTNVAITTDIITGFPYETEEDFNESYDFAKKMKFAKIHSFPYSAKKGTKAATFPNQVDNKTKILRNKKMIQLSNKLANDFLNNNLNNEAYVLFENKNSEGFYEGYTTNYIKVYAKSNVDIINQILKVKLISHTDFNIMIGEII